MGSVLGVRLAARPFSPTLQAGAAVRSQEWGRLRTAEMAAAPVDALFRPHSSMAPAASEPPGGVLICSKRRCLWAVRPNPWAERQELRALVAC